jgi:hypothetical protein
MSKVYLKIAHLGYGCNVCGGAIPYDTLEAASAHRTYAEPEGVVIEVESLRVWREINDEWVQVVVSADEFFTEEEG